MLNEEYGDIFVWFVYFLSLRVDLPTENLDLLPFPSFLGISDAHNITVSGITLFWDFEMHGLSRTIEFIFSGTNQYRTWKWQHCPFILYTWRPVLCSSHWRRKLLGLCGPPIGLARPLLATWKHKILKDYCLSVLNNLSAAMQHGIHAQHH